MNHRQAVARMRKGKCLAHDFPVEPSVYFDGGTCRLGCVVPNTPRIARLASINRNRWWAGKYGEKP